MDCKVRYVVGAFNDNLKKLYLYQRVEYLRQKAMVVTEALLQILVLTKSSF